MKDIELEVMFKLCPEAVVDLNSWWVYRKYPSWLLQHFPNIYWKYFYGYW